MIQKMWGKFISSLMYRGSFRISAAAIWALFMLMIPTAAFAEGSENPITKLKEKLKYRWDVLDNADFVFILVMFFVTLAVIAAIVFIIVKVVIHVMASVQGKANMWDKKFWLTMGGALLILFVLIGGLVFEVMESLFNWTNDINIEK